MAADTHLPVCVGMARALIPLAGHEEQEAAGESTPQRRKKSAGASQGDSPVKLKRPRIVDQAQAQPPKEKYAYAKGGPSAGVQNNPVIPSPDVPN